MTQAQLDACRGQALSCPHALDAHTGTNTFTSVSKEIDCLCFSKKRLRLCAYRRMHSPPRYDSWGDRQPKQSGGHGCHVHGREIPQDCPGSIEACIHPNHACDVLVLVSVSVDRGMELPGIM